MKTRTLLLFAGVALLALTWSFARAQPKPFTIGTASDFSTSIYYDPPLQDKLKATVIAAEAEQKTDGLFLLKKLKLDAFRETGERELTVEAPECLFDSSAQTASSAGAVRVQSGDGRLLLEGVGFLWQQKTEHLTISNKISTVITGFRPTKKEP
ncbi:MAG: hypothetical protein EXS35_00285 [Pedosphaera sp.]|nr:hypothetical protein [Pedosphaera sp.]